MLRAALLSFIAVIAGCSSVSVEDYAGNEPRFVPEEFFSGDLVAEGVVKNRGGTVIRRFTAEIRAYWRDGIGVLEEDFVFLDGTTDRRVWRLRPDGDGGYRGTAGDVVGEAQAEVAGNAMFLDYVLRVPFRGREIDLSIDDRMYLVTPDVLVNESIMRKFGRFCRPSWPWAVIQLIMVGTTRQWVASTWARNSGKASASKAPSGQAMVAPLIVKP